MYFVLLLPNTVVDRYANRRTVQSEISLSVIFFRLCKSANDVLWMDFILEDFGLVSWDHITCMSYSLNQPVSIAARQGISMQIS